MSTCASAGYPFVSIMNDIAIRVDHLSKLYPSTRLRGAPLWGWTRLRDALVGTLERANVGTCERSEDLWAFKDVSCEACPASDRRVQQGEVVGTLAPAHGAAASAGVPSTELRTGIGRPAPRASGTPSGRNGAGTLVFAGLMQYDCW
jgi:hypothetical protein